MINILCVKWGSKYGHEYVNNLYAGISRNTTVNFKLHCFTEDSSSLNSDIIIHDLPYKNLEGWWNKLYLFSNDIELTKGEKIFFIDLDTLIVGNIDQLLSHDCADLTVLRDFYEGKVSTTRGKNNVGSGLMAWYHGDYETIWTTFINDPIKAMRSVRPHGDQRWIQNQVAKRQYWQDIFPKKVVSFKVHCSNGLPKDAAIICYHGKPSIPDSAVIRSHEWDCDIRPQPWVMNHWKV